MKNSNLKIKSPKFIIFTDKDGTLNLEDKQLKQIFLLVAKEGGMIIPITGRTVGDIEGSFERFQIPMPDFFIGDNGATIYSTKEKKFLLKKVLEEEKVTKIINKFLEIGGNANNIRLANGILIHAANVENVKLYYKNNKKIVYHDNFESSFKNYIKGITKITLAGTDEQMEKMAKTAEKLDFWTDKDKTKFPLKSDKNYRLDISGNNINKGAAVKTLNKMLQPNLGYTCIGNGFNDITMFKQALDDKMLIGIMKNSPEEIIKFVKAYAQEKKAKAIVIPQNVDLANKYIMRLMNLFEKKINVK